MHRFALLAAFPLVALAGDLADESAEPALESEARSLVGALAETRLAEKRPPVLWSEILAVALREDVSALAAAGWTGTGDRPAAVPALADRCRGLHGVPLSVAARYHHVTERPLDVVPLLAILRGPAGGVPAAAGETRLAAAAIRKCGAGWLVGLAAVAAPPESTALAQQVLAPHVEQARSREAGLRVAALRVLGGTRTAEALPAMREALRHADAATREAAARALAGIRSRGAIPPLLHALDDAADTVRLAALAALEAVAGAAPAPGADAAAWRAWWATGAPRLSIAPAWEAPHESATAPLADLLAAYDAAAKAKDAPGRVAALRGLRDHPERSHERVRALLLASLNDPAREVRQEGCRGLAAQRLRAAVDPILRLLKESAGKDREVAQIALLALAQIGDLRALPAFTDSPWSAKDLEVLRVRIFAVRYLRAAGSVDWLVDLFTIAESGGVRQFAGVIGESLEFLTGEGHGTDGAGWKRWWKGAKGSFRPEPLPDDYKVPYLFDEPAARDARGR